MRPLTTMGLVLIVGPIIAFLLLMGTGTWEGIAAAFWFMVTIGPIIFVAGIVLLIVGLVTEQSEPQVVVVERPAQAAPASAGSASGKPRAPRVRCPDCPGLSPADARFCMECGRALA